MEALLHRRSAGLWVALGNVARYFRGSSGCIQSPIQRILSHALDGSQRLNAFSLSSMRSSGSANVQRTFSSCCLAATFGGYSGPQFLKFSEQCPSSVDANFT